MTKNNKESIMTTLWVLGIYLPVLGLASFVGAQNSAQGSSPTQSNTDNCHTVAIPYETERIDDPDRDVDDEYTETYGEDGSKEVCTDKNGDVTSTVTEDPTNEVIKVGTYVEPEEEEVTYTPYAGGGYNDVGCPKNQWVKGYYRSNGTYVNGYWRNSPTDNCQ